MKRVEAVSARSATPKHAFVLCGLLVSYKPLAKVAGSRKARCEPSKQASRRAIDASWDASANSLAGCFLGGRRRILAE